MIGPPLTKRGGLVATAPTGSDSSLDNSALVCSAQTCEHVNTRVEYLTDGPHHGKEICSDCGKILRWIPKSETLVRQDQNAFRIGKLLVAAGLTDWEREFLKSIATRTTLSPKQQAKLDQLCDEFGIGGHK